jgi:hypothetical protein
VDTGAPSFETAGTACHCRRRISSCSAELGFVLEHGPARQVHGRYTMLRADGKQADNQIRMQELHDADHVSISTHAIDLHNLFMDAMSTQVIAIANKR